MLVVVVAVVVEQLAALAALAVAVEVLIKADTEQRELQILAVAVAVAEILAVFQIEVERRVALVWSSFVTPTHLTMRLLRQDRLRSPTPVASKSIAGPVLAP